jgi:FkbM family methyltransferase
MSALLAAARLVRRSVGGDRLWRAVRPAYWGVVGGLTSRQGVTMALADGHHYRLDARLYAWQPELYEPAVVSLLERTLTPAGVFLDVGAHVGLVTLVAARIVASGAGRVVAIEPAPANAALLRRHVRINGFEDKVRVVEALVGDRQADAVAFVARPVESTANSLAFEIPGGRSSVRRMVTIDALVAGGALAAPDVIKIDVEGYEHHVIKGAHGVLQRGNPVVVCAFHPEPLAALGTSAAAVMRDMRALGYGAFKPTGEPIEDAGFEEVVFRRGR